MSSHVSYALTFGRNHEGQLGIAFGDDLCSIPSVIESVEASQIASICLGCDRSFIVTQSGQLLDSGINLKNELGRSGKKSTYFRVDAIETQKVVKVGAGENFTHLLCEDGKIISWGENAFGQLGNGNREFKDRLRVNTGFGEQLVNIASGGSHSIAITRSGKVVTWGANRWGQLGDGQITSLIKPFSPIQLRHRPVITISCGENHSFALTVGGNLYSWGDNSHGQLGQGDTTGRLRPELIKSLRSMSVERISAGRNHSSALTHSGLLLTFGSNSHGQCGLDSEVKMQLLPTVVERLRELRTLEVACGNGHTLVLCRGNPLNRVFAFGLNSSGQLGLGHSTSQPSPVSQTFQKVKWPFPFVDNSSQTVNPIAVRTGPLALHSIVIVEVLQSGVDGPTVLTEIHDDLPTVTFQKLQNCIKAFQLAVHNTSPAAPNLLTTVRETIASSFSSIAVLNGSFLLSAEKLSHGSMCVDLRAVRQSYDLIMSTEKQEPLIVTTLGRATLHLADQLKECPFDDAENLSIFLIVLENPLMLRMATFHVAIELIIRGILAIPKFHRLTLFKWLKAYPSEYFGRVVAVLKEYLSFACTNKTVNLDPTPAVLVLETLYATNQEEKIVPEELFYSDALTRTVDLLEEWVKFKRQGPSSLVFNFWSYPFLIDATIKLAVLRVEFKNQQSMQVNAHHRAFSDAIQVYVAAIASSVSRAELRDVLPAGLGVTFEIARTDGGEPRVDNLNLWLDLQVRRNNILQDVLLFLDKVLSQNRNGLFLPLRVTVEGELGLDYGGVRKEILTMTLHQLATSGVCVINCSAESSHYRWFHHPAVLPEEYSWMSTLTHSLSFLFGVLVGLAAYNGVQVDVFLPSSVFKQWKEQQLSLTDLWSVDAELARGLQSLLDIESGSGSLEDILGGATFVASTNPLVLNQPGMSVIPLITDGEHVCITRSNRTLFVNKFVEHALYGSAAKQLSDFFAGIKLHMSKLASDLCSTQELENVICGSKYIGNLTELKKTAVYKGIFTGESPTIVWFWDILRDLSVQERSWFLAFVTGSERVPLGGLREVRLVVQSSSQDETSLPTAHTCFNTISISHMYSDREQLETKLKTAIRHFHGFGFA